MCNSLCQQLEWACLSRCQQLGALGFRSGYWADSRSPAAEGIYVAYVCGHIINKYVCTNMHTHMHDENTCMHIKQAYSD